MNRTGTKKPLYRKVNTRAHGVFHNIGGDYRRTRHARGKVRETMHGKKRRGLDYTPLFRFLLSKVGARWDDVFSEAVARLDRPDPIFWLVARQPSERRAVVCIGESSYFSGLFVDESGILQRVDPGFGPQDIQPSCTCCTHTFNGTSIPSPPPR